MTDKSNTPTLDKIRKILLSTSSPSIYIQNKRLIIEEYDGLISLNILIKIQNLGFEYITINSTEGHILISCVPDKTKNNILDDIKKELTP